MSGPNKHIRTFTGKEINLFAMTFDDICIEDIAHALACINRFNGQVKFPISVAQHSIYVSYLSDKACQMQGMLHDASEAYIGDVTKWLKHTPEMKHFRELEDDIQTLIYQKFQCDEKIHPSVEMADRIMVRWEGTKGFGDDFRIDHPNYPDLTDLEIKRVGFWGAWSWERSESSFLARFTSLTCQAQAAAAAKAI